MGIVLGTIGEVLLILSALSACDLLDGDKYADTGDPYGLHGSDADADADADADPEVNNDGHLVYDTSVAMFMYAGDGQLDESGKWASGHFGNIWWGVDAGGSVCDVLGDWSVAGPAEGGCTGCSWSFELAVDNTKATGEECSDLAPMGAVDGAWDGMSYGFGWADEWAYRSGGNVWYMDTTILIFIDGSWFPFSYNIYGYEQVDGRADDFSFVRPIIYSYGAYYPN